MVGRQVVRGGSVVRDGLVRREDIEIRDGIISAIGPELHAGSATVIDASGLHVFPGAVDTHVHFNEPGRTDWEGLSTGSRAFAVGGGTTFGDMPLNNLPLTLDGASFDEKLEIASRIAHVDFALWGGLVPGNVDSLRDLHARGVIGVKAFMSDSGLPEFGASDDLTLMDGMTIAAELGMVVAVHAENDAITRGLTARFRASGAKDVRSYLASRPVVAETEAIVRAIHLAEATGARLHIVHVSSGSGAVIVAAARARGIDVSCETCPHYLTFTDEDIEVLGAIAKCAPPVRDAEERARLWGVVVAGGVEMVVSDHSPAPPSMKGGDDFFAVWGGISGVQSTLGALLTEGPAHGLSLARIASLIAAGPATRFGLSPRKGRIAVGADADLTLVATDEPTILAQSDLHYRHLQSPYVGRSFAGNAHRTILRGMTVAVDGKPVGDPQGRLVRPATLA